MIEFKARWHLGQVFAVHLLRLGSSLLLIQYIFPSKWLASTLLVDLSDRLVVLGLVFFVVKRSGQSFRELGISFKQARANVTQGLMMGAFLLFVSLYTEKIYATFLLVTPSEHPLVLLTKGAQSWQGLMIPLFLAGILAPITEEVFYRMFTFLPLVNRFGVFFAVAASSFIFALMHFNLYWLPEMMIVGAGLALLYYRTGSLVAAMVAHSFINSSKIFMIYVATPFS